MSSSPARRVPKARPRAVHIPEPLYDRLAKIQAERQDKLRRQVTFGEIIEQLLDRAGAA